MSKHRFEVVVFQIMTTKHIVEADDEDDLQEVIGELGSAGLSDCRTETIERKWEIQKSAELP
jgi:hypothetical protein